MNTPATPTTPPATPPADPGLESTGPVASPTASALNAVSDALQGLFPGSTPPPPSAVDTAPVLVPAALPDPGAPPDGGQQPVALPPEALPSTPPTPTAVSGLADRFRNPDAAPAAAPPGPDDLPPLEPAPEAGAFLKEDGTPDKAGYAFAQLRHEKSRIEREARQAQKELEEFRASKAAMEKTIAELTAAQEEAQAERDRLAEDLGRVSLAESPAFKQKYAEKADDVADRLTGVLQKFAGLPADQARDRARDILMSDPEEVQTLVEDYHASVQGAALSAMSDLAALNEQREQEIANWRQTSAALGVQSARDEVQRSIEERMRIAEIALDNAAKVGNPVFRIENEQDRAYAAEVSEAFKGFMRTATEEQLAHAAAEGFTAPLLYDRVQEQDTRIAQLETELQAFRRAERVPMYPTPQGAPPVRPPAPTEAPANVRPVTPNINPHSLAHDLAGKAIAEMFNPAGAPPANPNAPVLPPA